MSNIQNNQISNLSSGYNNLSKTKEGDKEGLEKLVKKMHEDGSIASLSPWALHKIADQYGVSDQEVKDTIETISKANPKQDSSAPSKEILNGNSGYYYGDSKVARSDDPMENMTNQAYWNRMRLGI